MKARVAVDRKSGFRDGYRLAKNLGMSTEDYRAMSDSRDTVLHGGWLSRAFMNPYKKGLVVGNAVDKLERDPLERAVIPTDYAQNLEVLKRLGYIDGSHYVGTLLQRTNSSLKGRIEEHTRKMEEAQSDETRRHYEYNVIGLKESEALFLEALKQKGIALS